MRNGNHHSVATALLLVLVVVLFMPLSDAQASVLEFTPVKPDLVVVKKSLKKLYLMRSGTVLKAYPIALGKNPVGHKQEEGDGRTPEGRYFLDWRNPESRYHRSIHISYPNDQDVASASARDKKPGAYIMIHGSPDWVPSSEWADQWLNRDDWTDGCIAVTNDNMDEIWNLVADGTPIDIQP